MTSIEQFNSLRWHRLKATLVNKRMSPGVAARPVSVFQAIVKEVTRLTGAKPDGSSGPHVFFRITDKPHTYRYGKGDAIPLEILICGAEDGYAEIWREAFAGVFADPAGGRNFDLAELSGVTERGFEALSAEAGPMPSEGEICLDFLMPVPFDTTPGRDRTYISAEGFARLFTRRFERLFGGEFRCGTGEGGFDILPYYWSYAETRRASASQPGGTQFINGCTGRLYIKGVFGELLPFLILGGELHAGTKLSNSQGYYRLHTDPPGWFAGRFPDRKAALHVVKDVLERYDGALEAFTKSDGHAFDEQAFADEVCRTIADGSYVPSPNVGFSIRKKDGSERAIERVGFRDLVYQQYVFRTVSSVFDRFFEEGSLGYRKGVSRESAVERVMDAVREGYGFVVESDVDDFFPSVDHAVLEGLLEHYLPEKDTVVKNIIRKSIRNGHVLGGRYVERTRGLAQGSPLSPMLANLYLDSFDEGVAEMGVRLVRYADDFIMLAKTREEAESVLSGAEGLLAGIGLKLNVSKTSIREVREGFSFLGIRFDGGEATVGPEQEFDQIRKPLYVTEPFLMLSVEGDALDVRKGGSVVETIPLRRLSEIIVMEKAAFSTALVRKCADENIPLTMTLGSGYYVATVKPDSKRYFEVSSTHDRRHRELSDTERLCIAKEFAVGKLTGYASLFTQRYSKGGDRLIAEIERAARSIHAASSVEEARGHEGATAKKIYPGLNGLIDNPAFHIARRDRRSPDMINSLLNFGYYNLFSRINATLRVMGLNPYLGFLHSPEDDYESLVCDVEELFRARVDRLIIRLLNLKTITETDFKTTDRGMYLTGDAVRRFLYRFEAEMEKKAESDRLTLKRNIYVQAAIIRKWALEDGSLTLYNWKV